MLKKTITILLIFPFIAISLFHVVFYPATFIDETMYAEWARVMYKQRTFPIVGGPATALGYSSSYPPAFYLLGTFIYSFVGENLLFLKLLSWITFVSFILLIYIWSKELFKRFDLILISILLFLTLPLIIWFSRLASHYMFLTLYFSLACYFIFKFNATQKKKFLYISSLFASIAALTSFLGLSYVILFLILVKPDKKNFKPIIFSLLIFFLLISPWYVRNSILLGNPLWPYGAIGKYIDLDIYDRNENYWARLAKTDGFSYSTSSDFIDSTYRLLNPTVELYDYAVRTGLRPIFTLFALPALLLYFYSKKKDKQIKFFAYWFLVYLILYIFFLGKGFTNYGKVVNSGVGFYGREIYLILISVPTVFLSVYFIKKLFEIKIAKWVVIVLLASIYIYFLFNSIFWVGCPKKMTEEDNFAYIQSFGDKWKQLEICFGNYTSMWKYVSENIPDVRIALFDYRLYYYNRTMVETDGWELHNLSHATNVAEMHGILKSNNISFIIVKEDKSFFQNFAKLEQGDNFGFLNYTQYFSLVKAIGDIKLYRVIQNESDYFT